MKERIYKIFGREFRVKALKDVCNVIKSFTVAERVVFAIFATIFVITGFFIIYRIDQYFMVEIPKHGGVLEEGVVGSPRFINPVIPKSDTDRDISLLVYSGLMRTGTEGNLIPDLAEKYTVSDDGLSYVFNIKKDAKFHDGTPVTADDVIFTIQKVQDPIIESPKRASWKGVTAEKIDDLTVKFSMKMPYPLFIENTTLGIIPKNKWKDVSSEDFAFSQLNIEPIGSGPYKITDIKRNSGGIPEYYELTSFKNFTLGEPYIKNIIFRIYPNEKARIDAYQSGSVDAISSVSPEIVNKIKSSSNVIEQYPLPRIFAVFFNQNQSPVLVNKEVRAALDAAVDKNKIISQILSGYGVPLDGPVPPGLLQFESLTGDIATTSDDQTRIDNAKKILTSAGWVQNKDGIMEKTVKKGTKKTTTQLSLSISTNDIPELKETAKIIQSEWQAIGASVDLKIFETQDLKQSIIIPRKYDALLFGESVGRDLDLYGFWHSSQRDGTGLNFSMYTSIKSDKFLEDARATSDEIIRNSKYEAFNDEVKKDIPAVFLYSPDFIYIIPKTVKNFSMSHVVTSSERFLNVYKWFIETDKVWKIFVPKTQ
ncbi:hypothetical protein IT397_02570 [Candidatus Nomurabacteria bacterium]|nr:hypothetical protein [Candidatus Nomurabacteria bacterium]